MMPPPTMTTRACVGKLFDMTELPLDIPWIEITSHTMQQNTTHKVT
jgi:hypothetical protein